MSVVLMGWELGGGLGHVTKLLDVARGLADRGHTPVLALKDLTVSQHLLKEVPFLIVQAPHCWETGPPGFRASSFTDLLAVRGYGSVEGLEPLVNAWQALIDLTDAELVIADFAPTLCLAAYGERPIVMIGPGFAIPPATGHQFPNLGIGLGSVSTSDRVLAVVQEVQRRRVRRVPNTLPEIFTSPTRFVRSIEELDPYFPFRTDEVVGTLEPAPRMLEPAKGQSFFAYLSAGYAGINQILADLASTGLQGSAYVRGAPPRLIQQGRQAGIRMYEQPPPLHNVLAEASVVIHHAGLNTAANALAAGRLQVTFPLHLEHILTSRALEQLRVGRSLPTPYDSSAFSDTLHELMAPGAHHDAVVSAAKRIESRHHSGILPKVLDVCDALASRSLPALI